MTMPVIKQDDAGEALVPYSLRDLLTTVFKRRVLIVVVLLTVVSIVAVTTLRTPRTYKVEATLLVNEARVEMPIAPTESTQLFVNRVSEEDLNSEIEVLKSRKLIETVVSQLIERSDVGDVSVAEADEEATVSKRSDEELVRLPELDKLVMDLQRNLEISAVKKSNVLRLSYVSTDPVWATRVVETLTDEYLKRRAERYQSPQAVFFFEQQMNEAESRMKQHQSELEEFVESASITLVEGSADSDSLAAQKHLVMERLSGLESSLGTAEADVESQTRQVERLREMLADEPKRLESSSQLHQDTATSEVERALMALNLERDRLLQDFKPDSRHVRDIDSQIELAEERLERATETSMVNGTEANPVYLDLKGDLLRAEVALEGTRAMVASLTSQVEEYRKQLDPLNTHAFALEGLRRNARTAEEDFLRYRKKHEEARLSAAMDQEKFINVTVAQPAQIPLNAEPRGLGQRLVLSVFLGFLGAMGLAFCLEVFLDRSFTTAEELEKRLGIPHIASIPDGEVLG